ncbi:MAG TPA: lactonase family protein [Kofleriaceae bacterium]|nr:lactonase family protein [Kofleriaceae bacterium]
MKRALCAALLLAACGGSGGNSTVDGRVGDDAAVPSDAATAHLVVYVSGYGPGIAWLDFDPATGGLTPVGSIAAVQPSFLAMTAGHLYAVSESGNRAAAYAIDPATGGLTFINDVDSGGAGPAHIAVDHRAAFVTVANFGGGTVAVLPIRGDGGLAAARQIVSPGVNAHMFLFDAADQFGFVPCRGSDYVAQYRFDAATGALTANATPHAATAAGAGPRHLAFAPDGAHAYLINELDSTLTALAYDAATGRLSPLQTVSTRAAGATGNNTGAEVWVHPSGKFVYGSNRGDDDLAIFAIAATGELTVVGHVATGGKTPRDFTIDPTGRWLLAANQGSDTVVTFAIDATTGMLTRTGAPLTAAQPAFVGFVALPRR